MPIVFRPVVRHCDSCLIRISQKSHIILDAKRPSLGSSELVFLFDRVFDKDVDCSRKIVLEMFDLQIICDNLFIALLANYWPVKNSVMKAFWA